MRVVCWGWGWGGSEGKEEEGSKREGIRDERRRDVLYKVGSDDFNYFI